MEQKKNFQALQNYLNSLTPEERRANLQKGGRICAQKRLEKRKNNNIRKSIAETLKDVLYTNITNAELLMTLEHNGIKGDHNYLVAMISSAVLRSIKKGSLVDVMKLLETLEGSAPEKIEIANIDKTVSELEEYLAKKRSDF
jgi:hypothetical protein